MPITIDHILTVDSIEPLFFQVKAGHNYKEFVVAVYIHLCWWFPMFL